MNHIENALITKVDLSMADHGCFTLEICLRGRGWVHTFGGYCLGHGYLDSDHFDGSAKGIEEIMQIMNVVGVEHFNDMAGKYVRVEVPSGCNPIKRIGNIVEDKWFDYDEFYSKESEVRGD